MIARIWRCIVPQGNAPHYVEHFKTTVEPELKGLSGFLEAFILEDALEDGSELTIVTLWDSEESIRAFAGDDISVAVIAPPLQDIASSFDATVTHSNVIFNLKP